MDLNSAFTEFLENPLRFLKNSAKFNNGMTDKTPPARPSRSPKISSDIGICWVCSTRFTLDNRLLPRTLCDNCLQDHWARLNCKIKPPKKLGQPGVECIKCSRCKGGVLWSRESPYHRLQCRRCPWCDGLTWIGFERFKWQVDHQKPMHEELKGAAKWNCDTCGIELPKDPLKCVVFTSHLGTKFTEADVTGVRCYPCDDKITDAMLEEEK